jgi:UDP-2,3-diacylglucosamine pyrophosphatase LpxH
MPEEGFVISDLHLGAGPADPLEDFVDDDALVAFVDGISRPDVTLIINGDFIDFAQIEPLDVAGLPSDLLWNEAASLQKLNIAIEGHPSCFAALGRFLDCGGALRIIVGNHDFDFAWAAVQARFREAVGDTAPRVSFSVGAASYAGVHIEHGYQFTPENCPRDPVDFIRAWTDQSGDHQNLERVWGTDFLLRFFNEIERTYPFIDHVKPTSRVVWHGLKHKWLPRSALVHMVVFLRRRGLPWRAIASTMDNKPADAGSLLQAFADDDWQQLAAEAVHENLDEINVAIAELGDEDRATLASSETVTIGDDELVTDPTMLLGRGSREKRFATRRLAEPSVTHVVFGHTHQIIDAQLDGSWFNPGCWIPHLDLDSSYVSERVRNSGLTLELFRDAKLFVTDRRAVCIRPQVNRAKVELINV